MPEVKKSEWQWRRWLFYMVMKKMESHLWRPLLSSHPVILSYWGIIRILNIQCDSRGNGNCWNDIGKEIVMQCKWWNGEKLRQILETVLFKRCCVSRGYNSQYWSKWNKEKNKHCQSKTMGWMCSTSTMCEHQHFREKQKDEIYILGWTLTFSEESVRVWEFHIVEISRVKSKVLLCNSRHTHV